MHKQQLHQCKVAIQWNCRKRHENHSCIGLINVYKRFLFFYKNIFRRFLFKKRWTVSVKIAVILFFYVQKSKNQTAAHKIIADFVFCT